jgi:hypothetical protein
MVMRSFDVERIAMTPVSGIDCRFLDEYKTIEELLIAKQYLTPVFVDENGAVELTDFVHPENALYIFGKANYAPFGPLGAGHLSVRIDCPLMGMLWPHQALSVIMYDRSKKG